jgi:Protein phosphatase 2C
VLATTLNPVPQESGTTATVAALIGWTVVVANVGDSLAFLDTGSEVVQVGSHIRVVTHRRAGASHAGDAACPDKNVCAAWAHAPPSASAVCMSQSCRAPKSPV